MMRAKWRAFVDEYFRLNMNGTRAYKAVYGVEDDNAAAVNASKLLRNTKIAAEIERRLKEHQLGADEVLFRLAEQATVSIGDFFVYEEGEGDQPQATGIDWKMVRSRGYLVKSVTWTRYGPKLELHDGQAALVHAGRHLQLFTDKLDITFTWKAEIIDLLKSGRITTFQVIEELGSDLARELFESAGIPIVAAGKDPAES